ncbi:MAG: GNAT family N-acetyltransferase [Chloroflexi bacterium]|nr:MAG: GNAT family N-acetyltransferase [Chloroflexota bacterium]
MKLTMRTYQNDEDYWRIREFLRRVTILNDCRELSWHVVRLDYWWWFANPTYENFSAPEVVFLWETEEGEIAAVLNPEAHTVAFLQIHPDFHTPELVDEMIATAEKHLAETNQEGKRHLEFYLDSQDRLCQEILSRHGFQRVERPNEHETQHRRSLEGPLPEVPVIPGYTIRSMGDGLELLERCYASGLGFHNDDIQVARDNRDHPEWYHRIQLAPLYRRDLDIVAVASDGAMASFCTAWFDDVSRTAYLEPVATVPAHRKHGLGKAVCLEAMHRLKRMGCKVVFVSGYSERANALYFSLMGPEHDISECWEKNS